MFGGGFGGRQTPSAIRLVRIALLIAIVVLGATLGHGKTYSTIHTVYIVIVVALLLGTIVWQRSTGQRGRSVGTRGGGGSGPGDDSVGHGGFGTPPPAPPGSPPSAPPSSSPTNPSDLGGGEPSP